MDNDTFRFFFSLFTNALKTKTKANSEWNTATEWTECSTWWQQCRNTVKDEINTLDMMMVLWHISVQQIAFGMTLWMPFARSLNAVLLIFIHESRFGIPFWFANSAGAHTHTFLFSFRLLNFTELEFESHHLRTSFTSRILTGFEVRDRAHPHFTQFDFGEFINELSVSICHFVFFLRFQVSVFPVFLRHKMCNVLNYLFTWMFQLEHCIESYKSFVYFLYEQYFCILFWRKDCWV